MNPWAVKKNGFLTAKHCLLAKLFLLAFFFTHGAEADTRKVAYDYELFDDNSGFPRKRINDILADEYGFLWLATEKGIIRYDLKNFVEIELENQELEHSECKWLRSTGERLYAVFPGNGFVVINLKDFTDVYSEKCVVSDIVPINKTDYAVLMANGRLDLRSNTRTISSVQFKSRKPGNLAFFKNNLFLSIPGRPVLRLDSRTLEVIDSSGFTAKGFLTSFSVAGDKLFLVDNHAYFGWDGKTWTPRPDWSGIEESERVTRLFIDSNGIIYSRYHRNLVILPKGGDPTFFEPDSMQNFEFYSICRTGSVIFSGTNQGLLVIKQKSNPADIINDNIRDNTEHVRVRRKIMELDNGELLLFGFPYTYRYLSGKFNRLCESRFSVIDAIKMSDTLYVSTEGSGLLAIHYPSGKANSIIIKDELDALGFYFCLFYDEAKKLLLVGSIGKLIAVDLSTRTAKHHSISAVNASVRSILRLEDSRRYLVGTNDGLFLLDDDFKLIRELGP